MSGVPYSVSSSTINVFGVVLVVHVLSDGQRIIEADSMHALLDAMSGPVIDQGDVQALAGFIQGREA